MRSWSDAAGSAEAVAEASFGAADDASRASATLGLTDAPEDPMGEGGGDGAVEERVAGSGALDAKVARCTSADAAKPEETPTRWYRAGAPSIGTCPGGVAGAERRRLRPTASPNVSNARGGLGARPPSSASSSRRPSAPRSAHRSGRARSRRCARACCSLTRSIAREERPLSRRGDRAATSDVVPRKYLGPPGILEVRRKTGRVLTRLWARNTGSDDRALMSAPNRRRLWRGRRKAAERR